MIQRTYHGIHLTIGNQMFADVSYSPPTHRETKEPLHAG